uniref:C2H2-type domain-containing protein n=1 Tax=Nothobranchius korthausae TaxID=1143690 RepID=A0A1A8H5T3_9TELE
MSPAAFHTQLASIMEVLANTAVAEICEVVDSGYAVLQLEISRSRKENEVLRRKLRLMELRATRTAALRAATANGSGVALLQASGRPRVHLLGGYEPRRTTAPTNTGTGPSQSSKQETSCLRDPSPRQETTQQMVAAGETSSVIKVEDDKDESWSQMEPDSKVLLIKHRLDTVKAWSCLELDVFLFVGSFCPAVGGRSAEREASSSLIKQEAADNEDDGGVSWTSGEVSSTSTQHALSANQRPETSSYDALMFELHQSSHSSQNPSESGGSSGQTSSENVTVDSGSSFSFSCSEVSLSAAKPPAASHSQQQRVLQKDSAGVQSALVHRDGWRLQNQVVGKTFVCNCCGKTLACLKNLKTHMRVHTGEKPFVCVLCGKRFSDSSNLKRHQSVHTGEKRFGCVHCGKRFAQSGSLKVHMSVHRDCKQFRCSFCGKTFTSGGHLRRHITAHSEEK